MANNRQALLEQLATEPPESYYEAPVDEPWQVIPGGSFAGSTRNTGIYRTEMPRDGFLGGYSNIGSEKVTRRPLASLSEDQILERQKARSTAMSKILDTMGGTGDMATSPERLKMAGQIVDGLFPETKVQPQRASANSRPTMNISGNDRKDRQAWFGGIGSDGQQVKGWTKEEINDRQIGVDIDTAREVIAKSAKAGMNAGQFKQLYNNMHPAVQAQIDALMKNEQETTNVKEQEKGESAEVQEEKSRGWAGSIPRAIDALLNKFEEPQNKVTLPMPKYGGPASSNELADQSIPEKGLMAPVIVGAKAARVGAKAAGTVKDFLNSDIIPEKGFGRLGYNPEANTWRAPLGDPVYTGIRPQANIRSWDEPERPRTTNSVMQTPESVLPALAEPSSSSESRSLADIGMGPGMGTRQAANGMNDMIRRGSGGNLPPLRSGMGIDAAANSMNSVLTRGFGSTNPQISLPDMPSMTSPDGTFLGINPESLTQFRGPAKEAVESISNFVKRLHEMSMLTQPNAERALRMAKANTEALIEHSGGSEVGMDELIETITTTFNILESGMGPEIADEYMNTYLGKSGLGGIDFQTPSLMKR